jgi:hypothetical protein
MSSPPVTGAAVVRYEVPEDWIRYAPAAIFNELAAAKAAMLALTEIPYQKSWADFVESEPSAGGCSPRSDTRSRRPSSSTP